MSRSLSKRVRFEIFKRDGFTCQYCGGTPPDVVLEVDHIEPVAEGGSDDGDNLVTSCFDCNRGKAAIPLSAVPESLRAKAARVAEAEAQIVEYRRALMAQRERVEDDCWDVIEALFDDGRATPDQRASVRMFLARLPYEAVIAAADTARGRGITSRSGRFRYFCAVCWGGLKEDAA